MRIVIFVGFIVAVIGFLLVEFAAEYRLALPGLIAAFGGGLALALAFREPDRTYYQLGWVLGMAFSFICGILLAVVC